MAGRLARAGPLDAGLSGAAATLAALFARDLTGQGQQVDVSEVEVMATLFMGSNVLLYIFQGLTGAREGHRSVGSGGLYPWTVLPCKDGYMCLIAREGRQ